MQVGLRPRLKARPSLVDLLRRSRQQEQEHLESHFESPPAVELTNVAASSHSSPPGPAPLLTPAANQELRPASLALEAQRIASTYQLPGSPTRLQPPSASPLYLNAALQQEKQPNSRSYPHSHQSQFDGRAAEPTAPPKMAPVSFVLLDQFAASTSSSSSCMLHAACYPRQRERDRANFAISLCRNKQQRMAPTQVNCQGDGTMLLSLLLT